MYIDYKEVFFQKHFNEVFDELIEDEYNKEEALTLALEILEDMYEEYQYYG